jgi:hypothetical protein
MKHRPVTIALISLCLVVLCFISLWIYFGIYGYRGTAANTKELARIYEAADPNLAAFYTNTFLHKLRFTTSVRWHRAVWRPSVTITSQVDMAAFRRDMAAEPFVDLYPQWISEGTSTVYSFKILHRLKDDSMVETRGTINALSGAFEMQSQTFFSKIDDSWWHQLTNNGRIDFTFELQKQ